MNFNKKIGDRGEDLVKDYLLSLGYQIVAQKWHCSYGEIDLIAAKENWLVFVEVKTRSVRNWDENGLLAISVTKQKKIILSAQSFLASNPSEQCIRFDVALVQQDRGQYNLVTYLVGAFE